MTTHTRAPLDLDPHAPHSPKRTQRLADLAADRAGALIRVPLPGSGFMVTYTSQGERDRTLRLAEARQQIAHEGNGNPTWQELTDDERGTSELSARNWLRAAERAGLLGEQGRDDTGGGDRRPYMDKPHHGPDHRPTGYGVPYRLADESPQDRVERDEDPYGYYSAGPDKRAAWAAEDDQADAEAYADDWAPGERVSADVGFAGEPAARWCAVCGHVEYTDTCPNVQKDNP